jgi:hypothetical protein
VRLDTGELARVVGEHPHRLDAEVAQDSDTQPVFALIGAEAQPLVGFDGVVALILKSVSANLVREADAAPFLIEIQNDAASFGGDARHGRVELRAAVAARRVKHVAREARRVDAHQHAFAVADVASHERDVRLPIRKLVVRVDLEGAELRRKLSRGDGANRRLPERSPDASADSLEHVHEPR